VSGGHGDGKSMDVKEGFEWTAHQLFKKDIGLNAVDSS